jgi:hypothetical protein
MKKAEGKAAIDYGFHMIITELNDQVELEMDALVRQGVTSFKLFMAYPGVFMLDDASIFKARCCGRARTAARSACTPRTAASSTCSCSGARRREDRAEVSRADAAGARRGRGDAPRDRARRDRRRARSTSSTSRPPRRSRW